MGDRLTPDQFAARYGSGGSAPKAKLTPEQFMARYSGSADPGYFRGAEGIGATPWHSQGMFAGRGPSVRDVLSFLPAAGGAIGGAIAAPGVATAVGGAALGGGAGEAFKQLAERAIGVQTPETGTEAAQSIGKAAAVQGAAELGGRAVASGLGKTVQKVLPAPEKQYAQALGATTNANKQLSEEIVPELIKRRVTGSREGIKELAEKQIEKSGGELDAALAAKPKGSAADVSAVMDHLQQLKKQYVVPSGTPGVNTIVDKAAYDNLSAMQKLVASTEPTFESVRRLRQILDGKVTAGDKTFGRTIAEGSELDATREAANAIRRELAKADPNIARINKEFSFWKKVDRVVGATIQRTASQSKPLGQQIAEGVATPVISGMAAGGQSHIAATVALPVLLRKLLQSPQWKTFSAVQKDKLADAIARGEVQQAMAYLGHGSTGLAADRSERAGRP